MGNRLSFGAEGSTHEAEILQSPSTKDEAKAAGNTGSGHGQFGDSHTFLLVGFI